MYRIGVDLGGTNIVSAVVDENNKIIAIENHLKTILQVIEEFQKKEINIKQ